jgi:hypothetical protein
MQQRIQAQRPCIRPQYIVEKNNPGDPEFKKEVIRKNLSGDDLLQ